MDSPNLLRKFTKHLNVAITSSGDNALMEALRVVKKLSQKRVILIPDQGGSVTYKEFPALAGFDVVELKTDRGVVNVDILKGRISNAAALILPSFAGYYAEQNLKEIGKICRANACVLIEDASGSIGDGLLCNGAISDIIIAGFEQWKIVNYGKYGFISSNYNLNIKSVDYEPGLDEYIANAPYRLTNLVRKAESVKRDLDGVEVFHIGKRGINVIAEYANSVIEYCESKGYEYVICPKYNKVNEKAVSIELKRLE